MYVSRYYKLNNRWNVKYIPDKPNGFAVFLISGQNDSVEEETSIWEHHPEKRVFLESLLKRGYTVLTSELIPNHWGNDAACMHSEQIIHLLQKSEIVNKQIHLFAEGTGAIAALKLLRRDEIQFRSMIFFNPCIYIEAYYELEKQNRLYYKKMKHELATAYGMKPERIHSQWARQIVEPSFQKIWPPLLLIHRMDEKRFPLPFHSRRLEQELIRKKQLVFLRLYSSTRPFHSIVEPTLLFFQKHEHVL
ncbi:hypothetical protein [Alkalicoccobacillus porphyridii]|uniref:Alpha/beta hydrolase n=1 Tax=Alkalicoccobacillus porphyridii TaxID=2597270 RepID=A0A553ZXG2_9BACI|nr:hypothetical protein [Alkalicoccobacillus porphyridii]TSB46142.1 hypothetical protein FN960_12310 [Alkalicoccobacillus porphyridii]